MTCEVCCSQSSHGEKVRSSHRDSDNIDSASMCCHLFRSAHTFAHIYFWRSFRSVLQFCCFISCSGHGGVREGGTKSLSSCSQGIGGRLVCRESCLQLLYSKRQK